MKKIVIFILTLLLITVAVSARSIDFDITIIPQQQTIKENETAVFNFTITHDSKENEMFEIYSADVTWDVRTKDILIVPGEGFATELYLRPLKIDPGIYGVPVTVRLARSTLIYQKTVILEVLSSKKPLADYLPGIRGTVKLSDNIDPREQIKLKINLENQNILNLTQVDIKARSKLINKDYQTRLDPLQRKTVTFEINLNPKTKSQEDILRISVFAFDRKDKSYRFDLMPVEYEVISYGNIETDEQKQKGLLTSKTVIMFTNNGNKHITREYKIKTSLFRKLFTSIQPNTEVKDNFFTWKISLSPGETHILKVKTNYWSLVVLFLLIVSGLTFYFIFRSPIVIKKKALIKNTREGGISELQVIISVFNRSAQSINSLKVLDVLPGIARLVRSFGVGTIEPNEIKTTVNNETILKWDIPELESGVEMLLTYRLRSRLSIIGGMNLPPSHCRFSLPGSNSPRTIKSNLTSISLR